LRTLARATDADLARAWTWPGKGAADIRNAFFYLLMEEQNALVAAATPMKEADRILVLAQRAFGDLRGLLLGLPTDLLDRPPRAGEWPVRETLRHMLVTERRYAVQTRYALERADAEPLRIPDDRLPTPAQMDVSGEIGAVLARIGEARAETNRWLGEVPPVAMTRPTIWVGYDIDVRFRLHRFAPHIVEHTVQCEKTLEALGWRPTEGRRIARYVAAAIGEVEGLGALKDARELETQLAERIASVVG